MPKKGIIEEKINDNFTKIHISERDIEPVLLIYAPPIDYIKPGKLLNIMNIPTTEYSQEPDSRTNMQLYIDDILANHHNRNIAQLSIVQDRINELGGYNNGKLEFDDNTIEGSLQIAIELLEIINSNLNDLLGLVSVNNFLLGMMGITGVTDEYVSKDQLEEMKNDFNQLVNDKTKPDPVDVFFTAVGTTTVSGAVVEKLASVGIKIAPLPVQIAVALAYYMYKYRPETPPTGKTLPNYLTGQGGYTAGEGGSNYPANRNYKSSTENTDNLQSITTQELTGLAKATSIGYPDEMLKLNDGNFQSKTESFTAPLFKSSASWETEPLVAMSGVTDENTFSEEPSIASKILTPFVDYFFGEPVVIEGSELTPNMANPDEKNVPKSRHSSVESQPLAAMSGVTDENTFSEEQSSFSKFIDIITFTKVTEAAELPTNMSNSYQSNMPKSMRSSVESQPLVAMSGVTDENAFSEEKLGFSEKLTTIIDILTLTKVVEGAEIPPDKATNMYSRNLFDNNTYENKKNTNAIKSEDLYNNMYNERNYGPQKFEHIYNMPITNNTTVNVKNEPDYEKVTSYVIKSMSNGLHSVAAARGRLMPD